MADADVLITAGSGTKVDTRTVGAGVDEHRQVVVIGDPATAANVQSVTSAGEAVIGGNLANDAVDSGNPVKIGGRAQSVATYVAAGDRVDARFTRTGDQYVTLTSEGENVGASVLSTASGSRNVGLITHAYMLTGSGGSAEYAKEAGADASTSSGLLAAGLMGFNGATYDRVRVANTGRLQVDVITAPTTAVTGTFWQATQPVSGTVTANAGTGTLATSLAAGPPPHNVGITPLSIAAAYTTTQTSANLLAGTGGQKIYVSSIVIATGGTTAGRVSIYWGAGAFSAGTSVTLFDGEFAPSATSKPGAVMSFTIPRGGSSATGDNLRITTSAAMTVYVSGMAYKA